MIAYRRLASMSAFLSAFTIRSRTSSLSVSRLFEPASPTNLPCAVNASKRALGSSITALLSPSNVVVVSPTLMIVHGRPSQMVSSPNLNEDSTRVAQERWMFRSECYAPCPARALRR